MSLPVKEVVDIEVKIGARSVSQVGFGVGCIFGPNVAGVIGTDLYRSYSDPAAMITDGFAYTDPEYLKAVDLMSQESKPASFLVAVCSVVADQLVATYTGSLTAGTVTVKVNGESASQNFDTDQDTTMTALAGIIQALDSVVSCVWENVGQTLTIVSVGGKSVSFESVALGDFTDVSSALTAGTSSLGTDIAAVRDQNDDFYGVFVASESHGDILKTAETIEATDKRYFALSSDKGIGSASSTDDIGKKIFDLGYNNTRVHFYDVAGENPDAAFGATTLANVPGSVTESFKQGVGITPMSQGQTFLGEGLKKNVGFVTTLYGSKITFDSKQASGVYGDIITLQHWVKARMTEATISAFINNPKIPFTNDGTSIIRSGWEGVIRQGQANGGIDDAPGSVIIEMPDVDNVPENDKINRIYQGSKIYLTITGAVHKVQATVTFVN